MKKNLLLTCVVLLISSLAIGQSAILDPTFGSGSPAGTAIFSSIPAGNFEQGIAILSNGKIYVTSGNSSGITRLNADGSPNGGWATSGQMAFTDIAIQADSKVLCIGKPSAISYNDLYVYRFKTDGTLDSTFGINGRIGDSSIGGGYGHVAIQPGNKIIFSGGLGLKRVNMSDGSLDASFGTNGFVRLPALALYPYSLLVDNASGNIVLAGVTKITSKLAVTRLMPNGAVDGTFGTGGVDSLSYKCTELSVGVKLAALSSGKVIMASDCDSGSSNAVLCACFNTNGSLDNTFATNGTRLLTWNSTGGYQYLGGLGITFNDQIVVGCTLQDNAASSNSNDIAIQRLGTNGTPDVVYGVAKLNVNNANDRLSTLAVQPDGRVVVNGSTQNTELVARFTISDAGVATVSSKQHTLNVYPNPAGGEVTIVIKTDVGEYATVDLCNVVGQKVMSLYNGKVHGGSTIQADLRHISEGVYFVRLMMANGSVMTEQLIVE